MNEGWWEVWANESSGDETRTGVVGGRGEGGGRQVI